MNNIRKTTAIAGISIIAAATINLTGANAASLTPTATVFNGVPHVGTLFLNNSTITHGCTATVIQSPHHDEILTAAHCIVGDGTNVSFAPGYNAGARPYGTWKSTKVYVPSQWSQSLDPAYDYAILTIAKNSTNKNIQDITGGLSITSAAQSGSIMNIPAYNMGSNDKPIQCNAPAYRTGVYSTFDCNNYNDGVSGSPLIVTASSNNKQYISGVIGGYKQGGCTPSTSYASPFNYSNVNALIIKADSGVAGMTSPRPGYPQC